MHAILAASYTAFGDDAAAAAEIDRYFELVTTGVVATPALEPGGTVKVGVVPGQTLDIPLELVAGESISISVGSKDYWDTIALLSAPDGTLVAGSDDTVGYHAALTCWPRRVGPTGCGSRFLRR